MVSIVVHSSSWCCIISADSDPALCVFSWPLPDKYFLCVVITQALQARRTKCEHQDWDPIVWTCHRVMKWIRDIDLKVGGRSVTVFP